jgi:probable addiction module antidote protein
LPAIYVNKIPTQSSQDALGINGEVDERANRIKHYIVPEYLKTLEEVAAYLEACIQESEEDSAFIEQTLGDIPRAKGMTKIFLEMGLSREGQYNAIPGYRRSPNFDKVLMVITVLGLKLSASVKQEAGDA